VLRMLRSNIRSTPSQLHSLQQIPTQHDMLPQHLVYKNELNREYVITLARKEETIWWWSEKFETCRSVFKCFKWKLYRCICWLIVEVILRNAWSNDDIHIRINSQDYTVYLTEWNMWPSITHSINREDSAQNQNKKLHYCRWQTVYDRGFSVSSVAVRTGSFKVFQGYGH